MEIKKAKRNFEQMMQDITKEKTCLAFDTKQCSICLKYCGIENKISFGWDIEFIRNYYKLSLFEFDKSLQKTIECKNNG